METIRIPYKKDAFGKPLYAKIAWSKTGHQSARPIALVYHGGGVIVGSSEIIPEAQIKYLAESGFVIVIPNYRLAPQVTGKEAFDDCEAAYDWALQTLPEIMDSEYGVQVDSTRTVALGHSSGGSISLHIASCKPVKAVTAFYPSLFNADTSTSAHQKITAPPFGSMPDFVPNDEEWASISPADYQVSEAAFALPGTVPAPRNKWQMSLVKNGQWLKTVQPDGDYRPIDPMTRLTSDWCPVMLVQGELDNLGGSSLELAQRAEKVIREAGIEVELTTVQSEAHMFDLPPIVGTTDLGPRWVAVKKGLDWLVSRV